VRDSGTHWMGGWVDHSQSGCSGKEKKVPSLCLKGTEP